MKKLMSLILVLSVVEGLVATAEAGTEAGLWYPPLARPRQQAGPPNVNAASDNVLLTASAVTVFEIQDDAGPTYVVCLESATQPSDKMTDGVKYATITSLLPEPTTIAVLGLAGLLFHRPRIVRSVA
jgi:hypothetical protein